MSSMAQQNYGHNLNQWAQKRSNFQFFPSCILKNDRAKTPHLVSFQCFVFFLIFAFSCLSFSSFPLLLDFLKPKSGPSNEVIGKIAYVALSRINVRNTRNKITKATAGRMSYAMPSALTVGVARLQNEVGTNVFFSRHEFSHEKCSEISPNFLSLYFLGPKKSRNIFLFEARIFSRENAAKFSPIFLSL